MKKSILKVLLSASIILSAGLGAFAAVIAEGSTTVLPIAQKTAESLMNANPAMDISIRGGGSGVGINSLLSGRCDIAMSSRAMKDGEKADAAKKKVNPKEYTIAMDAIVMIVHNKNAVTALTREQIKDIFTGKITNWKQLGGADKKIVVISRDGASGTFETFNELALNGEKVSKNALMQASNQNVASAVERAEGAIGYVGLGYIGRKVKVVSIEGITPSIETVLNKKYVYSRSLFFYTNGAAKGAVKEYIDFVLSKAGQDMIKELGFVPLNQGKK
ncbi:MAG: phosphate ABC transporter substrate-binding protein [Elusimicrobiota bacterium]|jgi:phosphate transport system substrate-binding protein|nr:phosphate ABC transporter substrate-binding protein [Elusimicrobiota bacterium]